MAATNATMRVDRTTVITSSHSDILATTMNHDSGADASYSKYLRSKSRSAAKIQQQQTREYKSTPQVPPHQVRVKQ
jgi:hypothetical protein